MIQRSEPNYRTYATLSTLGAALILFAIGFVLQLVVYELRSQYHGTTLPAISKPLFDWFGLRPTSYLVQMTFWFWWLFLANLLHAACFFAENRQFVRVFAFRYLMCCVAVACYLSIIAMMAAMPRVILLTCPAFEPLEALTLTFFDAEVHASHVVSDADAWERIASGETSANDSQFVPRERTLGIPDLPTVIQGWRRIADAIERADSCMSDNPAGISFYHLAFGNDVDSMRVWFNPTEGANPLQCRLLDAYMRIKARLSPV